MLETILPILIIPFLGTMLGASFVFFLKQDIGGSVQKLLLGFASGVMVAASFWSLLNPAIEMSGGNVMPAAIGFLVGMGFLLALDHLIPHIHLGSDEPEGPKSGLSRTSMVTLAVTLHNIPEGMAVGVVLAGALHGESGITAAGALAMAVGIAIQNVPEGAIVSFPLRALGRSKRKAFLAGALSGMVEPIAAVMVICLSDRFMPLMPYLLAFAAGAMLYVVVEELIPEAAEGEHSNLGPIGFALGFCGMMVLYSVME